MSWLTKEQLEIIAAYIATVETSDYYARSNFSEKIDCHARRMFSGSSCFLRRVDKRLNDQGLLVPFMRFALLGESIKDECARRDWPYTHRNRKRVKAILYRAIDTIASEFAK